MPLKLLTYRGFSIASAGSQFPELFPSYWDGQRVKERSQVSASTSTDRIEQFFYHLAALKGYARRVIVRGDSLSPREETDRANRIQQFLEIGFSFDLTEKEIVTILYRELFASE